jgi:murein peptide amidase A
MRIINKKSKQTIIAFIVGAAFCPTLCLGQTLSNMDEIVSAAFINIPSVLKSNIKKYVLSSNELATSVADLCNKIGLKYQTLKWSNQREGCGSGDIIWKSEIKSNDGYPLIYSEFGSGSSTTLILGGVHPDEITPIPLVFRFANHLNAHKDLIPSGSRVIIAPLVNPDGYFKKSQSRTNGHGVDLNRNFFTQDWYASAKHWWSDKRQKNIRHFPGHIPNSEIETLFQIWLIDTFKPDKIISIHAPLGFYDYDGPGDQKPRALTSSEVKAKTLVQSMSESSRNYKIVDYSFYPGSLGNYAGNERGIPTVTLELETTNPQKIDAYWIQFSPGLERAVRYPFTNSNVPKTSGASLFLENYGRKSAQSTENTVGFPAL